MQREYHQWFSNHLKRQMELLVFGHAGARVLLFPTRTGRFFDYENYGLIETLRHPIEMGWLQIYCLDSMDQESFYCFWTNPQERINRHLEFENYVLQEVIPFSKQQNAHTCLIAAGCSMGAFHAVNIAFRHPHLFAKVVGLSGRYDLTIHVGNFNNLFEDFYCRSIFENSPSKYVPTIEEGQQLDNIRKMDIVIVCGKNDPFIENNRTLSQHLDFKNVKHKFHEWESAAHNIKEWKKMLPLYI